MHALTISAAGRDTRRDLFVEAVFNACRANPKRESRCVIFGGLSLIASFCASPDGTHVVTLKSDALVPLATAIVDEFDC